TGLRSVARVYTGHALPPFLALVGNETCQLRKTPPVEASLRLSLSLLDAAANRRQVLQHNRASCGATLNYPLAQYVVAIPGEAQALAGQFPEMALGRPGAFGLQGALEAKSSLFNLFPTAFAKKSAGGSNSGVCQAQINPDGGIVLRNLGRGNTD